MFPDRLVKDYTDPLMSHKLRREIISTSIANDMVNHMGITFVERLRQSTGSTHLCDCTGLYHRSRCVCQKSTGA